jgi:hypothetical protein
MKVPSAEPTQSTESAPLAKATRLDDSRCRHRTPSGRRCKLPTHRPGDLLCLNHQIEYKKADAFNLQAALLADSHAFQTAQGINNALQNLYGLLANNYISARRASVLAYISSLLLRTLPAIDAEQAATLEAADIEAESPETEDAETQETQPDTATSDPDASEVTASADAASPDICHPERSEGPRLDSPASPLDANHLNPANAAVDTSGASTEAAPSDICHPERSEGPRLDSPASPLDANHLNPADPASTELSEAATKPTDTAQAEASSGRETSAASTETRPKPAPTKTKIKPEAWPEGLPEPDPTKKPS